MPTLALPLYQGYTIKCIYKYIHTMVVVICYMKTATMYVESRLVYTISNPWGDMKAITIFAFAQSAQMPPNIMYKMISTSFFGSHDSIIT